MRTTVHGQQLTDRQAADFKIAGAELASCTLLLEDDSAHQHHCSLLFPLQPCRLVSPPLLLHIHGIFLAVLFPLMARRYRRL